MLDAVGVVAADGAGVSLGSVEETDPVGVASGASSPREQAPTTRRISQR
jgi:hypothetical protein